MTTNLISLFILGIVHGITPDEHTWPIISSYTISQRQVRKAVIFAFVFSLFEMLPWIIISSICAFVGAVVYKETYEVYVHIGLGIIMLGIGIYMTFRQDALHIHIKGERGKRIIKILPLYGLITGLGPCLPVLSLYTFAAETHNIIQGVILALSFSLGTMISLLIIALILGKMVELAELKWKERVAKICVQVSGMILVIFGIVLIVSECFLP